MDYIVQTQNFFSDGILPYATIHLGPLNKLQLQPQLSYQTCLFVTF